MELRVFIAIASMVRVLETKFQFRWFASNVINIEAVLNTIPSTCSRCQVTSESLAVFLLWLISPAFEPFSFWSASLGHYSRIETRLELCRVSASFSVSRCVRESSECVAPCVLSACAWRLWTPMTRDDERRELLAVHTTAEVKPTRKAVCDVAFSSWSIVYHQSILRTYRRSESTSA
jgi:hypothetical protein